MDPVGKAVWYIESHFAEDIGLDHVAAAAGLSKYHFSRLFVLATGWPVMRYVRARRLSEAARRLADGSDTILAVAIAAGYGSHEAFTRAFSDQFGVTPDTIRAPGGLQRITLVEPLKMPEQSFHTLPAPRLAEAGVLRFVGIRRLYSNETSAGIPAQWQDFQPHIGSIPHQTAPVAYGIRSDVGSDGEINYMCAVEVTDFDDVPPDLDQLELAPQSYLVFRHDGHVSEIRRTWHAIFAMGLEDAGHVATGAPSFSRINKALSLKQAPDFERYGESFDPQTGSGGIEIWIPVETPGR